MIRIPTRPNTRWTIWTSIVAIALTGGVLAAVAFYPMVSPSDAHFPSGRWLTLTGCLGVSTCVLFAIALHLSLRARSKVGFKTICWCALFGAVNVGAAMSLSALVQGRVQTAAFILVAGTMVGILVGSPFGFAYGLAAGVVTPSLRSLIDRPTLTAHLDAQRAVGLLIVGTSTLATLFLSTLAMGGAARLPVALPVLVGALGMLFTVQAGRRKRRFVAIARQPETHGYERVPISDLGLDSTEVWPLHADVPTDATHALVRRAPESGDGAYRISAPRVPLALVE